MQQPKLYQLLSTFSKKEIRAFLLFLQSPYFNKSDPLLRLYEVIKPYYPHFNSPRLTKENIYKKLKLSSPFNEKFINDRSSDLSKLVEIFMAIHLVKTDDDLKRQMLRKSLRQHQLDQIFVAETKKAILELEQNPTNDWRQAQKFWDLKYDLFLHPQTKKWNSEKDVATEMIHYLDESYVILKLRYGFHHKTWGNIFKDSKDGLFLKEIIAYAQTSTHPVIKLYLLLLATFEVANVEKAWKKAHKFYQKNLKQFSPEDQLAGLLGLINRGYKIALGGKPSFHKTNLQLFKFGLEKKILLPEGQLSEQAFKNIVLLGSVTKEFDWTRKFMEKYQPLLPPGHNPNLVYLSHAYLAFYSKKYDLCDQLLKKNAAMDTRDKLNYKSLELRCLYEQYCIHKKDLNFLLGIINNYEQFLQRSKKDLSKSTIKAYQNFVYLVKRLAKIKHLSIIDRRAGKKKIKAELPKRLLCMSAEWLKEKIEEL